MRAIQTSSSPTTASIDAGEYFDTVTGPFGDIGRGNPGVQPPDDACMPEIVRPFHQWCCQLFRGKGQRSYLPPDLPPGGRLDHATALASEETTVGSHPEALDVLPKQANELRRDRHFTDGLAGATFEPAVLVYVSGVGPLFAWCRGGVAKGEAAPTFLADNSPLW